MKIGADNISNKPLLYRRYCLIEEKGTATVTYIKYYPSFLCFKNKRFYLPVFINRNFAVFGCICVCMRPDITRTQMLHKKFFNRERRMMFTKINHNRYIR